MCFQKSKSQTYILMETKKTRKMIEMNRNWCLLVAQISFLSLTERHEAVPGAVCQLFGGITHFVSYKERARDTESMGTWPAVQQSCPGEISLTLWTVMNKP